MPTTETIYNHLTKSFWTKRKCSQCQQFFTKTDWDQHNYQLLFKEIGSIKSTTSLNYAVLEKVIAELQHKQCPLATGFNYQKEIFCQQLKDNDQT